MFYQIILKARFVTIAAHQNVFNALIISRLLVLLICIYQNNRMHSNVDTDIHTLRQTNAYTKKHTCVLKSEDNKNVNTTFTSHSDHRCI
jgi:hypothetical protein